MVEQILLVELYKKRLPNVFERFFAYFLGAVFVKVTPALMVTWVGRDGKRFLEYLDLEKKKAYLTEPEKQEH